MPRSGPSRRRIGRIGALGLALLVAGCTPVHRDTDVAMRADAGFEPAALAGRWYEVARFPVVFQRGCTATTATYTPRPDGSLSVLNRCRMGDPEGPERSISGRARAVGPGRLEVRLGWIPVAAPYWVLGGAQDGSMVVVGVPSGRAGWILARSPAIPDSSWAEARAILAANGYDVTRLVATPH